MTANEVKVVLLLIGFTLENQCNTSWTMRRNKCELVLYFNNSSVRTFSYTSTLDDSFTRYTKNTVEDLLVTL